MPNFMGKQISAFISQNPTSEVYIKDNTEKFDLSLIVIWFIALAAVVIGSLWTRHEFINMLPKSPNAEEEAEDMSSPVDEQTRINRKKKEEKKKQKEEENKSLITLNIGYISIFLLLIVVCSILLLLYFFYNIMSKLYWNLHARDDNDTNIFNRRNIV